MFQSAARSAPRRILASRLPLKTSSTLRFLSTAPPSQKSRTWKSSAARWALAIAGVYYYNTSTVFAEQPEEAISRLDQSLHHLQDSKLPTLDSIVEEKRQRLAEQEVQATPAVPATQDSHNAHEGANGIEDLEDEADQQGAFNPETGEINWDCPCLGGMAHGPCGEEFKAAFSCFVYSKEEPKGMECIDKFKSMQDCFRQHPEMYGSELEDDEDELEEELRAESSPRSSDASHDTPTPLQGQPQPSRPTAREGPEPAIESPKSTAKLIKAGDEGSELVPKAAHDGTSK